MTVTLSSPTNGTISDATGVGTITSEDGQPQISINDPASVAEGTSVVFNVTLSNPSYQTITVAYSASGVTATSGDDYDHVQGLLTFNPNETGKTITVTTNNDEMYELTETFQMNLSSETNATLSDGQGIGTITDNDTQPTISIDTPASVEE